MLVLLVEDDDDLRECIAAVLELGAYHVGYREANNGLEALELLANTPDGALPNVIILDVAMPVMNGFEFREAQLADPRIADIPVIAISASHWSDEMLAQIDPDVFLPKPFTIHQLDLAIATCVVDVPNERRSRETVSLRRRAVEEMVEPPRHAKGHLT